MAFNTDWLEKDYKTKKGKKKEIISFIFKKVGHYSSQCKEELPKDSQRLENNSSDKSKREESETKVNTDRKMILMNQLKKGPQ